MIVWGPRTEEWIVELLVLLLRHHVPEEGIQPRRGGEETKVTWELQVGRIGGGERIMEVRGNFQREVAYCLRIKWWATALSTTLMRKWPKQCNLQISSSFYHLQWKCKGTCVMMRIWLGKDERSRCEKKNGVYKGKEISRKGDPSAILRKTRVRVRTLREERKQCFILSIICLLEQACNKPIKYIYPWSLVFLSYFHPWSKPSLLVWSTLSQIYWFGPSWTMQTSLF